MKMSAFIVEQQTINRAITGLDWCPEFDHIRRVLAGIDIFGSAVLGRHMMDLNIDAVNQRYGENTNPLVVPYRFYPATVSSVQAYKSLSCWRYQCSEGNVPQRPLFQIMERYRQALANKIITALPEWERAEWD